MWKACKEVEEEFENMNGVRLVQLKRAVESDLVVFGQIKTKRIEVVNAGVHSFDHPCLKLKQSRIIEGDPYVASESRGCIVTHRIEAKLKFVWLREDRVDEDWLFGIGRRV